MPFTLMFILHAVSIALNLFYIALMWLYRKGWRLQQQFVLPESYRPATRISIIIPARNEAANISVCLESILRQDYPRGLFQVVVVDDHSTDETADIVQAYNMANVYCISLADHLKQKNIIAYKKAALSAGIASSNGELIVTTDADCIVPLHWLKYIAAIYEQQKPAMIVAPVDFTADGSLVHLFQSLDFMSMQGITAAAHKLKLGNMGNGANLAFTKAAYDTVNGYEGIDHLASGDDYLLMTKIQQAFPGRIAYLKSKGAIVKTAPQPDWNSFFQQRIRWASKSGKYDDKKMTGILLLVYLLNLSFLLLLVAGISEPSSLLLAGGMLLTKTLIELVYLYPVAKFFNKTRQLLVFPLLQPLHILYIIIAGFLGFIGVYRWKGRTVK